MGVFRYLSLKLTFRSEEFARKRIRIPRESAGEILSELGKLQDCLEFIDLNKDDIEAKKNFGLIIKRCEEMEKKIFSFEIRCEDYGMKLIKFKNYKEFIAELDADHETRNSRVHGNYFDMVENEVMEDEKRMIELIDSYTQIDEALNVLSEKKEVLIKTSQLIASSRQDINEIKVESSSRVFNTNNYSYDNNLGQMQIPSGYREIEEGFQSRSGLDFLAGVVKAGDEMRMKRMIFRISKGRALTTFWDFETEKDEKEIKDKKKKFIPQKKIFAILFQGGEQNVLQMKILKVCDLFSASRYYVPKPDEIDNTIHKINHEICDKISFLNEAENSIKNFLQMKCGDESINGKYSLYRAYFKQEKIIYSNLNKCILRDTFIDGELWIPKSKVDHVQNTLKNVFKGNEMRMTANLYDSPVNEEEIKPPTYIPTNDFLWAFQEIVDTYGIPRYGEINPTYFNIVTFPFLFGVMFGDIGHGLILFVFGAYLCLFNSEIEKDKKNLLRAALKGRYLIMMMGFFAFYCGWLYNDFFSVPIEVFPSCYENDSIKNIGVRKDEKCVYPFGMDHKWYVSTNELAFFNSFKMKLSVILGVLHMLFGIFLKGLNSLYFRDYLDFFTQFIPQFIFMSILFGYMDVLIFVKWSTDWDAKGRGMAPNLINQIMNIFLKLGSVQDKPVWGEDLQWEGRFAQEWFHLGVLILSLILIPLMLLVKPLVENRRAKSHKIEIISKSQVGLLDEEILHKEKDSHEHQQHSFSDIFIHQVIETIEFVLGSVSNTASYLRLWALSLAHGQLSKVFFEKSFSMALSIDNVFIGIAMLFVGYFIFAGITFFVLMCMDSMECFLHTLRLHWVEFQNKFYKADGYKFNPFSFKFVVKG